ncbi:MAG: hypothetical protein ACFFDT_10035 [Candidatus Hodarchaeota archaeon]
MAIAPLTILTNENKAKYLNWVKAEFGDRILATPDTTIQQIIDNAVRYWNTHSAYKISQMVPYNGQKAQQLSAAFKSVAVVYPNKSANWIWNEFPTWSLAGIAVLDNIRTDIILATEAFRTFNIYVGANFRNHFEENHDDPTKGGYLYTRNVPTGTSAFFVVGTKRILPNEDITSQHINNWLLYYIKALVKQAEGHMLRAASLVLPNGIDGQTLYVEGKEEMKELQTALVKEGQWVSFIRRQ